MLATRSPRPGSGHSRLAVGVAGCIASRRLGGAGAYSVEWSGVDVKLPSILRTQLDFWPLKLFCSFRQASYLRRALLTFNKRPIRKKANSKNFRTVSTYREGWLRECNLACLI